MTLALLETKTRAKYIPLEFLSIKLGESASLDHVDDQHNERDNQENVD